MPRKHPLHIIRRVMLAMCLLPMVAFAKEVALQLPSGLKVHADYRAGVSSRPAVLVLHGFLQTHNFSTVRLIANELSDAGYAVLSPTLSLNIDQRRASLTCDAIQNHSVNEANLEIAAWVDWLKTHGFQRIVLVGHSTGSNHLLSYLHANRDSAVIAFIASGIGPMVNWQHPEESRRQRAEAEAALAAGNRDLKRFSLGFCHNNYMAPASNFLSYMRWDAKRLVHELKTSPVPTTVVLGSADNWVPPDWADTIADNAIPLQRIKDANHYFSGIAEFDFQATILSLVESAEEDGSRAP